MNQLSVNQSTASDRILIVEGYDESAFCKVFLNHLGINDVTLINAESKDKIKSEIESLLNNRSKVNPKPMKIGIMMDADDNKALDRYNGWVGQIKELSKIKIPKKRIGTFSQPDTTGLSFGVYITPHPNEGKMIEDLCLATVSPEKITCLNDYVACCQFSDDELTFPKRKMRIFLATYDSLEATEMLREGKSIKREKIDRLEYANHQNLWDFDHPNLSDLKAFLLSFALDNI